MTETAGYVLVGIIAAAATVVVAFIARRTSKDTAANAFTANLLARLDSVEDKYDELEKKYDGLKDQLTLSQRATVAAVRFIDRLVDWGRRGGVEKMPTPSPELHEYLDPTLWEQASSGPDA